MARLEVSDITKVAAGDDAALQPFERYDGMTIFLHWLTTLLVITLFGLSQVWGFLPRGTPAHDLLQRLHVSLGFLLTVTLLVRIVWRTALGSRAPVSGKTFVDHAARAMHYLLYALLVTMVLAGLGKLWTRGKPIVVFDLVQIPAVSLPGLWRGVADTVHEWGAWTLMAFVLLHASAALYHHYGLHDGILRRMLPGTGLHNAIITQEAVQNDCR